MNLRIVMMDRLCFLYNSQPIATLRLYERLSTRKAAVVPDYGGRTCLPGIEKVFYAVYAFYPMVYFLQPAPCD
jgi:hypothetical protein